MTSKFLCSTTAPIVQTKYGKLRGFVLSDLLHGFRFTDEQPSRRRPPAHRYPRRGNRSGKAVFRLPALRESANAVSRFHSRESQEHSSPIPNAGSGETGEAPLPHPPSFREDRPRNHTRRSVSKLGSYSSRPGRGTHSVFPSRIRFLLFFPVNGERAFMTQHLSVRSQFSNFRIVVEQEHRIGELVCGSELPHAREEVDVARTASAAEEKIVERHAAFSVKLENRNGVESAVGGEYRGDGGERQGDNSAAAARLRGGSGR